MNNEIVHQQIAAIVSNYAAALNNADASALAGLYKTRCLFKAPGRQPVIGKENISPRAGQYFKKYRFSINIEVINISVEENVAFVTAQAQSRTELADKTTTAETDDYFVLVQEGNQWKIQSYFIYTKSTGI